ncbi:unnamed protein product [Protopolystoma xenopodis]|uniref:Uncharacterized protein n=1 Tax=Protopolystoma xenopodis TaxID=117903 RepID=A0A3S5A8V8_9PLAT|nr:unnamed protein product [Protopolystoma xenopodis]
MTESELVNSAVNAASKGKSDRANPIRAVATAKRGPYSFVSLVFPVHLDPPTAPILPLASFLLHKLPPPPPPSFGPPPSGQRARQPDNQDSLISPEGHRQGNPD